MYEELGGIRRRWLELGEGVGRNEEELVGFRRKRWEGFWEEAGEVRMRCWKEVGGGACRRRGPKIFKFDSEAALDRHIYFTIIIDERNCGKQTHLLYSFIVPMTNKDT